MARLSNPLSSNCPSFICLSSICLSSICVGLFASGGRQGLGGEIPVRTLRVPNGGIQPLIARGKEGELLLVYYSGKPGSGDLYLLRSRDDGDTFGKPLRINQQEGSAVATGNIRGAQIAVGKNGRIHVAWNGSSRAMPRGLANPELPEDSPYRLSAPMLYTRLRDDGSGFEPERNVMQRTFALDGGGSVAADATGKVYVLWHGSSPDGGKGEGGRAVWIARSTDDGKTFSTESRANPKPTGACGCCGLRCFVDSKGALYALYRTATDTVHRNMRLLFSTDSGRRFESLEVAPWKVAACVMSSSALVEGSSSSVVAAWETEGQVYFADVRRRPLALSNSLRSAPGKKRGRRFPALATNHRGEVLLAWTEGMRWKRGGAVAWAVFDRSGKVVPGSTGRSDGVPTWSLVAAFARSDGSFVVVY